MNARIAVLLAVALPASYALAQSAAQPLKNLPDPYEAPIPHWGNFADGHPWGSSAGVEIGPRGGSGRSIAVARTAARTRRSRP